MNTHTVSARNGIVMTEDADQIAERVDLALTGTAVDGVTVLDPFGADAALPENAETSRVLVLGV